MVTRARWDERIDCLAELATIRRLRRMSGDARLRAMIQVSAEIRAIHLAGLRARHPRLTKSKVTELMERELRPAAERGE